MARQSHGIDIQNQYQEVDAINHIVDTIDDFLYSLTPEDNYFPTDIENDLDDNDLSVPDYSDIIIQNSNVDSSVPQKSNSDDAVINSDSKNDGYNNQDELLWQITVESLNYMVIVFFLIVLTHSSLYDC